MTEYIDSDAMHFFDRDFSGLVQVGKDPNKSEVPDDFKGRVRVGGGEEVRIFKIS